MTNDKDKCPSCGIWYGAAVDLGASCPKKNCFMRNHMPSVEPSGEDAERVARAIASVDCDDGAAWCVGKVATCTCVTKAIVAITAMGTRSATAEKGVVDREALVKFLNGSEDAADDFISSGIVRAAEK